MNFKRWSILCAALLLLGAVGALVHHFNVRRSIYVEYPDGRAVSDAEVKVLTMNIDIAAITDKNGRAFFEADRLWKRGEFVSAKVVRGGQTLFDGVVEAPMFRRFRVMVESNRQLPNGK